MNMMMRENKTTSRTTTSQKNVPPNALFLLLAVLLLLLLLLFSLSLSLSLSLSSLASLKRVRMYKRDSFLLEFKRTFCE